MPEKEAMLTSLKEGYMELKKYLDIDDELEVAHIKGYCGALEQMIVICHIAKQEEVKELRRSIVGTVTMALKRKVNLDEPSYLRRKYL